MNDARRLRSAKQVRRDVKRARKRESGTGKDDLLITTIRSSLSGHPGEFLAMASYVISRARLEPPSTDGADLLAGMINALIERPCRETSALLAVLAELLVDDEELRQRCRRESANRHDHLPKWIVELPRVEVRRVVRRTEVLGDGDELRVGLALADGTELALSVYLDHNILSTATDLAVLTGPRGKALKPDRENDHPASSFEEMDPADAREWIEVGLERPAYIPMPRAWRESVPLARWMLSLLPAGGTGREKPEWDEAAVAELLDRFFSSKAGAAFPAAEYREFLEGLCDDCSGDPWRWSAARISYAFRYTWCPSDGPLEIALDTPALLRAFIPFAHADCGIAQELTDETIAKIDEKGLAYRRAILLDASEDDEHPWFTPSDRAS